MKHMLIMRATQQAVEDYANMDFEAIINAMGAYNESMMTAGVLVAGEGLAQEAGYVVDFAGETPIVSDGPYGEVHELFNGFWIIQTSTAEEAIEWAKRAPLTPGKQARGTARHRRDRLRGLRGQRVPREGEGLAGRARHRMTLVEKPHHHG